MNVDKSILYTNGEKNIPEDIVEVLESTPITDDEYDISKIEIDENDSYIKSINDEFDDIINSQKLNHDAFINSLKDIFTESSIEELEVAYDIAVRLENGEDFSVFNNLPKSMQNVIVKNMDYNRKGAHLAATELFKDLINQIKNFAALDAITEFKNKHVSNMYNDAFKDAYENFLTDQKKRFDSFYDRAKVIRDAGEDEDKAKLAESIADAYNDIFTLNRLRKDVESNPGKYRVKKIDKEQYKKRYKLFNSKFKKEDGLSNLDMNVVQNAICDGFEKYMPEETKELKESDIVNFLLGFIKFTSMYSVDNIEQKTFMSYFVTTALTIRLVTNDDVELIKTMLNNILDITIKIKEINK